jgi:colanic acid biosynthesis protein WcaH
MSAALDAGTFLEVVRHAPLVAMDLLVRDASGRVLLGERRNAPARGWWFVPGGRIRKGESLAGAFTRITRDELGTAHELKDARLLGVMDHHYPDNFAEAPDVSTHYVVMAFEIEFAGVGPLPEDQHSGYRWFTAEALCSDPRVHRHTRAYLDPQGAGVPFYAARSG